MSIVFLHGFLQDHTIWKPFLEAFKKNNCLAINLNHAKTIRKATNNQTSSIEDIAIYVKNELDNRNIKYCTLIGHSMGGYIIGAFLSKFPEYCKQVILINSTLKADTPQRKQQRSRMIEIINKNLNLFYKTVTLNLFENTDCEIQIQKIDKFKKGIQDHSKELIIEWIKAMRERNSYINTTKSLAIGKHYILSQNDKLLPLQESIKEAIKINANYDIVNTGHMSIIEDSKAIINILKRTLES